MKTIIRRFKTNDAQEISNLIGRNFIEINSRDYPLEEMIEKAKGFSAQKVMERANNGHMYIVLNDDKIIGTGTISD